MKLAIASTVALLLLFAAQTPASAASAQALAQAPHPTASQGLVDALARAWGLPGLLWLSPLGILRLRLLSSGLRLLLSAIPLLGFGLAVPALESLVSARQISIAGACIGRPRCVF